MGLVTICKTNFVNIMGLVTLTIYTFTGLVSGYLLINTYIINIMGLVTSCKTNIVNIMGLVTTL